MRFSEPRFHDRAHRWTQLCEKPNESWGKSLSKGHSGLIPLLSKAGRPRNCKSDANFPDEPDFSTFDFENTAACDSKGDMRRRKYDDMIAEMEDQGGYCCNPIGRCLRTFYSENGVPKKDSCPAMASRPGISRNSRDSWENSGDFSDDSGESRDGGPEFSHGSRPSADDSKPSSEKSSEESGGSPELSGGGRESRDGAGGFSRETAEFSREEPPAADETPHPSPLPSSDEGRGRRDQRAMWVAGWISLPLLRKGSGRRGGGTTWRCTASPFVSLSPPPRRGEIVAAWHLSSIVRLPLPSSEEGRGLG